MIILLCNSIAYDSTTVIRIMWLEVGGWDQSQVLISNKSSYYMNTMGKVLNNFLNMIWIISWAELMWRLRFLLLRDHSWLRIDEVASGLEWLSSGLKPCTSVEIYRCGEAYVIVLLGQSLFLSKLWVTNENSLKVVGGK
jgi:hypothetical protein